MIILVELTGCVEETWGASMISGNGFVWIIIYSSALKMISEQPESQQVIHWHVRRRWQHSLNEFHLGSKWDLIRPSCYFGVLITIVQSTCPIIIRPVSLSHRDIDNATLCHVTLLWSFFAFLLYAFFYALIFLKLKALSCVNQPVAPLFHLAECCQ